MEQQPHRPVLLKEVVAAMNIREDGYYLDATAGRGGHIAALLACLGPKGRILALDRDPQAVAYVASRFHDDARITVQHARFSELARYLQPGDCLDGILFDFGVSSPQLDEAQRGFSFLRDGPLDMRMNPDAGISAAQWLETAEKNEIRDILKRLGEERHAGRIAAAIVREREAAPIATTSRLASLIDAAVPMRGREKGKHPATRSFQAIRIHINAELEEIADVLPQALQALCTGGRLLTICFHSLEDRIVKRFMRHAARGEEVPPGIPVRGGNRGQTLRIIGKPLKASPQEVDLNPRSRSAILRVAERLPVEAAA
jgi:16S rRNA (cytosine1402-N4)-methyltransferase